MSDVVQILRKHPLFEKASAEFLTKVANLAQAIQLKNGQVLFSGGEAAVGGFLVIQGMIRLFLDNEQNDSRTLRFVQKGDSFAEPMMFGVKMYPVSAEAVGPSQVLLLPQSVVVEEIRKNPDLAIGMLMTLSMRLKHHVQTIRILTVPSSQLRLLLYLQDSLKEGFGEKGWCDVQMSLSRKDLASRLNIAPETLSRLYKKLKAAHVLMLSNHRIKAVHTQRLDALILDLIRQENRKTKKQKEL
jgi:CRP-like cAMP-binding protein